jgi:hypothetical protein
VAVAVFETFRDKWNVDLKGVRKQEESGRR